MTERKPPMAARVRALEATGDGGFLYHVLDGAGFPMCGIKARGMRQVAIPGTTCPATRAQQRCQRVGCKEMWPS